MRHHHARRRIGPTTVIKLLCIAFFFLHGALNLGLFTIPFIPAFFAKDVGLVFGIPSVYLGLLDFAVGIAGLVRYWVMLNGEIPSSLFYILGTVLTVLGIYTETSVLAAGLAIGFRLLLILLVMLFQ